MWIGLALLAVVAVGAGPASGSESPIKFSGDVRVGVLHSERTARSGARSSEDELRARLRLAVEATPGGSWKFRARVAGRPSSAQGGVRAYVRAASPEPSGAAAGDITIDEFYLERGKVDGPWWLRIGRFQSRFDLQGVAAKSLDRNDSPNMDVNWTDGVHLRYDGLPGWRLHAVLERNAERFASSVRRAPLDFSRGDAGVGLFLGLEAVGRAGPLVQRMVSVTWLPDGLATRGPGLPERSDYTTITARVAAALYEVEDGPRLTFGVEVGHAFHTPFRQSLALGGAGRVGGNAWQGSLNLEQFRPGHSVGFVLGRAEAGWLLSPDFRNNDRLAELRYQWRLSPDWSIEARLREREELDVPGPDPRRDRDAYVRLSGRFAGL